MKIFKIKKKNGAFREICAPNYAEKARLRLEAIKLSYRVENECNLDIVHGFVRNRSPITNALKHKGFKFTLSADLKNFFDTISHVYIENLTKNQQEICFVYMGEFKQLRNFKFISPLKKAKQGLPTSPMIANLACKEMDKFLLWWCSKRDIVYTRYADDLTFSSNSIDLLKQLRNKLDAITNRFGFDLNKDKTRIQSSIFGRREITGVMVDDEIHVSRDIKRRLRSAIHHQNKNQIHGLSEWSKLKLPNPNRLKITPIDKTLARHLGNFVFQNKPNKWELSKT